MIIRTGPDLGSGEAAPDRYIFQRDGDGVSRYPS